MTTLIHLRNAFEVLYKDQCRLRQIPENSIPDNTFKLYFDMTYMEMEAELSLIDAVVDVALTPVTVYTTYSLGVNFGGLRGTEVIATNGEVMTSDLELKYITQVPTVGSLIQGTPNSISIIRDTTTQAWLAYIYPLAGFAGTLRVRYKYLPSISTTGVSDLSVIALTIPDLYIPALLDGIMSRVFPDVLSSYYAKLSNLRLHRANPVKPSTDYQFGGFDED